MKGEHYWHDKDSKILAMEFLELFSFLGDPEKIAVIQVIFNHCL